VGRLTRLRAFARRARLGCAVLCLAVGATFSAAPGNVTAAAPSEYQLKAVFLFNFAQFVEWPQDTFATADAPLVIGVVGADPFGSYLDEVVQGEQVKGRALTVRRFRKMEDARDAHILFLGEGGTAGHRDGLPASLAERHVLTVSDAAAASGAIIQFVDASSRIKLRIDAVRAEQSGLTISSKLLRAAEIVNSTEVRR
jgi:hypothetical protein